MLIQSIFGLQAHQIIKPELLDVKFLFDESWILRARTRKAIMAARMLKMQLESSRYLIQRRVLTMELESVRLDIKMRYRLYRGVYSDALKMDKQYREGLKTLKFRWQQEDAAA